MWPIELLLPIDFTEWERLHKPPQMKRGRRPRGTVVGDGTSEVLRTSERAEGVGGDTHMPVTLRSLSYQGRTMSGVPWKT